MARRSTRPTLREECERSTFKALDSADEKPLDELVSDALAGDDMRSVAAIVVLGAQVAQGRREALVALRGLLCELPRDARYLRGFVVSGLSGAVVKTQSLAEQIIDELRRTKPFKYNAPFFDVVADAVCSFPNEAVRTALSRLETDGVLGKLPASGQEKLRAKMGVLGP